MVPIEVDDEHPDRCGAKCSGLITGYNYDRCCFFRTAEGVAMMLAMNEDEEPLRLAHCIAASGSGVRAGRRR
jgi:hypothetical protein